MLCSYLAVTFSHPKCTLGLVDNFQLKVFYAPPFDFLRKEPNFFLIPAVNLLYLWLNQESFMVIQAVEELQMWATEHLLCDKIRGYFDFRGLLYRNFLKSSVKTIYCHRGESCLPHPTLSKTDESAVSLEKLFVIRSHLAKKAEMFLTCEPADRPNHNQETPVSPCRPLSDGHSCSATSWIMARGGGRLTSVLS